MATAVTMPRLGLTMVEGTVVEWRARPGEPIAKGEIFLAIESEKVEVEIEAFAAGTLAAIYVEAGVTVSIGALLGAITEAGEAFDRAAFEQAFVPEVEGAPAGVGDGETAPPPSGPARAPPSAVKAAPAARALAKRLGVDLETLSGSGPGGRVTVEDVERASKTPAASGLAIDVIGEGPPLLLIAGFGVDRSGWRPQIEGLKASHTVIAYDHRGIGASRPVPDDSLTIAVMAKDALDALADRSPATVVGASMGAAVAIELALARPDTVRRLVLITPAVEKDARLEAVLRSWIEFDAAVSEARIRSMLAWFLSANALADAPKREATAQALRSMAGRTPIPVLRHHARALGAWLGTRAGDLGKISVPTLVIAAGEDLLVPAASAERLARSIPDARYELLEGSGHAVTIERAEEVNELIAELVARSS